MRSTARLPAHCRTRASTARSASPGISITTKLFSHIYLLDFILPFGTLTNGKIDGQRVSDAPGAADPVFSLGV
jgi:hypothetical protein